MYDRAARHVFVSHELRESHESHESRSDEWRREATLTRDLST